MPELDKVIVARDRGREVSLARFLEFLRVRGTYRLALAEFLGTHAIRSLADDAAIGIDDAGLQERVDRARRALGLFQAADTKAYFDLVGVSQDAFEHDVETRGLEEKLIRSIPESDVQAHFKDHAAEYAAVKLYRIDAENSEAASEIRAQLKEGRSFQEIAAECCKDESSRDVGGFVGWVVRSALPREVADLVFRVKAGEVIGPVDGGVFLVAAKREDLTESLRERIRARLFHERIASYLRKNCEPVRCD